MLSTSKLFQNMLSYSMRFYLNNKIESEEKHTDHQMLALIDEVMGSTS
jgi:hypothetical protein